MPCMICSDLEIYIAFDFLLWAQKKSAVERQLIFCHLSFWEEKDL